MGSVLVCVVFWMRIGRVSGGAFELFHDMTRGGGII